MEAAGRMTKQGGAAGQRKGNYNAPALDKAFLIIELLANNPQGLLASEMASVLGRSLGELFRIVVVMEEAGYLQKSKVDDRYTVTYKFLDVAYRATPARQLVVAAQPEMKLLAAATGQSCHLVVAHSGEGLVMAREENPGVRGFALRVGASIDLVRSCSGHVLLAFSTEEAAGRMLERAVAVRNQAVSRSSLSDRIRKVREQGYALRESSVVRGVTDISYPIFAFGDELLAALTIPYLELIDGSQVVSIVEATTELSQASLRISQLLGWQQRD